MAETVFTMVCCLLESCFNPLFYKNLSLSIFCYTFPFIIFCPVVATVILVCLDRQPIGGVWGGAGGGGGGGGGGGTAPQIRANRFCQIYEIQKYFHIVSFYLHYRILMSMLRLIICNSCKKIKIKSELMVLPVGAPQAKNVKLRLWDNLSSF